jgi:hypothetical protein
MSLRPVDVTPLSIVAAVVVRDAGAIGATVRAIGWQYYEPERVVIIGGDSAARDEATALGALWYQNVPSLLDDIEPTVSHLWLVTSGSMPRQDALDALVTEAERVDAGVAGSKLLLQSDPDRLASIGIATDLFDVPYVGLDPDEIDAGQYDVVRDVAALELDSLLIRRDLARGVAGLDRLLAPEAAAIDLCQRARMRGARIVVVPSSEVLVPEERGGVPWEEEAGRIRAMIKAYSVLTLLWALPVRLLIGAVEAVVSPFLGRWTLLKWVKAWLWNVYHLPSTISLRRVAHRGETLGDAELFRYQLRGSARLRTLGSEIGSSLRDRLGGEDRIDIASIGSELRQPAFIVGGLAVAFSIVSTRSLWSTGFPSTGFSLPLPSSGSAAVAAYAGGWNPAGFGSAEPLRPFIGMAGALQVALFDNPAATAAVLVLASMLAGIWGTNRLLRRSGVEAVPALVAGVALVAGPAARAIASSTGIEAMVALGAVPWAVLLSIMPIPSRMWKRIGRVSAVAVVTGIVAVASPALIVVPVAAVTVRAALRPGRAGIVSLAVALGGGLLALPLLMPWVTSVDVRRYVRAGTAFWEPGVVMVALLGVAALCGLVASPTKLAVTTAWGGILTAGGALLARADMIGAGRDVEMAGLAIASLGTAIVVGSVVETIGRVNEIRGWRRVVASIGSVAAVVVAMSSLGVLLPGRAGLPRDGLTDPLRFAASTAGSSSSRILLVGPADTLPGDARTVRGAAYRVVSAPRPELWEVWLPASGPGDAAFDDALRSVIDGDTFRAGEALAPFGIRWVIVLGDTPFESVFQSQLDMAPLEGLELTTFTNDAPNPARAMTSTGAPWAHVAGGYEGTAEPGERVLIAETADTGWGPAPWQGAGWRNSVSAVDGAASFRPLDARREEAYASAGLAVLLLGLAWRGRRS